MTHNFEYYAPTKVYFGTSIRGRHKSVCLSQVSSQLQQQEVKLPRAVLLQMKKRAQKERMTTTLPDPYLLS